MHNKFQRRRILKTQVVNILALFAVVLAFASQAQAQWMSANANVQVYNTQVDVVVSNTLPTNLYCSGYIYGQTATGHVVTVSFNDIIPPNQYRYGYAYTNPYNPFVNGWANIDCRF